MRETDKIKIIIGWVDDAGCMFHSEGGLRSFEHPMNKMKAMPRIEEETTNHLLLQCSKASMLCQLIFSLWCGLDYGLFN